MKFLLFADLHHFESANLNKITDDFDVIIFLGDIDALAMKEILNTFPSKPSYAILGNHDSEGLLDSVNNQLKTEKCFTQQSFGFPVKNINCIKIDLNEISFAGLQGSVKYKDRQISYTQKEALALEIPRADILFSHETGYHYLSKRKDVTHEGYKAVSKYIKRNKPTYHIFGHYHKGVSFKKGKTYCYCIYGCSIFDSKKNEMKKMF